MERSETITGVCVIVEVVSFCYDSSLMKRVTIRLWGVRGAIASPSRATVVVGGNTSCLEINDGKRLVILDAGTGIRFLGEHLIKKQSHQHGTILFSHVHLDHTVGLPFFEPLFSRKNHFLLAGPKLHQASFRTALLSVFHPPSFPVPLSVLPAKLTFRTIHEKSFSIGNIRVTPFLLHHPGGVLGYRFDFSNGSSFVYATDSEPKSERHTRQMIEWVRGADLFIHDAQYTPKAYRKRVGWGHSPYTFPIDVAAKARVKRCVLFHHSPSASDRELALLLQSARGYQKAKGYTLQCDLAKEGKVYRL